MANEVVIPCGRLFAFPLDLRVSREAVAVTFSRRQNTVLLESLHGAEPYGRFSIYAFNPVRVVEWPPRAGSAGLFLFRELRDLVNAYPAVMPSKDDLPGCGWIGFFAYEAGLALEGLKVRTRDDLCWPVARFGLYDHAAVFDAHANKWFAIAVDWPGEASELRSRGSAYDRCRIIETLLTEAARKEIDDIGEAGVLTNNGSPAGNMTLNAYLAKVARAKTYIAAGDIYQVNLTQRFEIRTSLNSIGAYRRLRRASPANFAAYMSWNENGDGENESGSEEQLRHRAVMSSSPELFLQLCGRHVRTRPIKGTRPRGRTVGEDLRNRQDLFDSEKDEAELAMIVDLLRNDIGKVSEYGSVRVVSAVDLETHPKVFHRVATIDSELRAGCDWCDLLEAAFPGGSITGVPKIRAMQIIDELEPTRRGVYCGSVGLIGLDGSLILNIAIRTMVQEDDRVFVHAGGGIIADSEPMAEYEECLAKALGMFEALGCAVKR